MVNSYRFVCSLAILLAGGLTNISAAINDSSTTSSSIEADVVDYKPTFIATGTAKRRKLATPLTSSGVAVELEELLPETMENGTTKRIAILQGDTALLPCKAYSLGQRTVSWIRRRDWHIMSSGSHVYTADNRFSILNRLGSPDWILMLKSPQLYDSGTYECQIADGQGQVSHFVELLVWLPVAYIVEGGEHHVEAESNIQLHCKLHPQVTNLKNNSSSKNNTNTSSAIEEELTKFPHLTLPTVFRGGLPFVWFHNGRPLAHGSKSSAGFGSVSVYLEGVPESDASRTDWMAWTSRLVIQQADPADSGNYTCAPWRGKAASVNVFVSQGDRPAAVQRQSAPNSFIPLDMLIFGMNFLLLQIPLRQR